MVGRGAGVPKPGRGHRRGHPAYPGTSPPPPPAPPELPEPVRLVAADRPNPFAPGCETVLARVAGDGLRALDVRDGDHVVLVRRESAEHGDLAAVLDDHGQAALWKVYPEAGALRLSTGRPGEERSIAPPPSIHGVVVAVLRRLR